MQRSEVIDNPYFKNLPFKQYGYETPYSHAPELCIEIVSPSNSKEEMTNKVQLYLQAGAAEVWIVWENGIVDYYDKTGKLEFSGYGVSLKMPVN
jgi:Uma2 family endonuclease